jgi:hypothetical protein
VGKVAAFILILFVGCQGPQGLQGPEGAPGAQGTAGQDGAQGPQGIAGTGTEVVKLCASDNSVYPEYALRIGNQLYAVYWGTAPYSGGNKTAFLALLIPGNYSSTGGNGCSFTVNSDGSIN